MTDIRVVGIAVSIIPHVEITGAVLISIHNKAFLALDFRFVDQEVGVIEFFTFIAKQMIN